MIDRVSARYTPLTAPGPSPRQMVRDIRAIRRNPLIYLERMVAEYGDLVTFPLPRTPVLLVNDPQGARRVLVERARDYTKQTVQYRALSAITGSGLLTADGGEWRQRRRIVQPAFHHGGLGDVAEQAVAAARRMTDRWLGSGAPPAVTSDASNVATSGASGAVIDVDDAVMQATLEVVGRTLFGVELGAGERIVAAVHDALRVVVQRARTPVPGWWPGPSSRRLAHAIGTLDEACAEVVRTRRARQRAAWSGDLPTGSSALTCSESPTAEDLLGLLLRAADADGLSDAQVRDELVTLVIAGHETVASALGWTLQLLAEHPAEQHAVAAEVAGVLAGRPAGAGLGWADLPGLRRTRQVVDEALRLYPPAWLISRRAAQPDSVAGVQVPAGTLVIISPWLLHRRPQAWPDPIRFDPDRFAPAYPDRLVVPDGGANGEPVERSGDHHAGHRAAAPVGYAKPARSTPDGDYLPFGVGPRLCIGREFALVEAVLMLATVLSRVRVAPVRDDRGAPIRPVVDALVTLRPRDGLPLRVRPA
ncbi:MAG: cytochrome P450 [Angustibacter sp.]